MEPTTVIARQDSTRRDPDLEPARDADLEEAGPDELVLEDIVAGLAPRLLRFARGRYGPTAAALAEEASQDALTALVMRWRRHGPPDSPAAFAFAVLRRRLARARVRRALSHPLEALRGEAEHDDGAGPDHLTGVRRELREVRGAVGALAPKLREALLLVTVAELDTKSAAGVLCISASALKMRVSRARSKLRERLGDRS